jgi:hypothetical protein
VSAQTVHRPKGISQQSTTNYFPLMRKKWKINQDSEDNGRNAFSQILENIRQTKEWWPNSAIGFLRERKQTPPSCTDQ